jgi:hypothetical protein
VLKLSGVVLLGSAITSGTVYVIAPPGKRFDIIAPSVLFWVLFGGIPILLILLRRQPGSKEKDKGNGISQANHSSGDANEN